MSDKTGVSIWELREMARNMENKSTNRFQMMPEYRQAVIVEALRFFADAKEQTRELNT